MRLQRVFRRLFRTRTEVKGIMTDRCVVVLREAVKVDAVFVGYWLRSYSGLVRYSCHDKEHGRM